MKRLFPLFIINLLVFNGFQSLAQNKAVVDSLERRVLVAKSNWQGGLPQLRDSASANILLQLSKMYWGRNVEKATAYARQSLNLSEKIGFKKGAGNALNSLGTIYSIAGEYPKAIPFYTKALAIRKETRDLHGVSATLNNLANANSHQGKHADAIQFYLQALKIDEQLGDEAAVAMDYGNMASVYYYQKEFQESLEMYEAALKVEMRLGRRDQVASIYLNLGVTHTYLRAFDRAEDNLRKALLIFQALDDKGGEARTLQSLGNCFYKQNSFTKSLDYFIKAQALFETLGDSKGKKTICNNLAFNYFYLSDFAKARTFILKSLELSKELHILPDIANDYHCLSMVDSATGNYKDALNHEILSIQYRDSVLNRENTKKITQQRMQFEFDKKETVMRFEKQMTDQELEKSMLLSQHQGQEILLKEQSVRIANQEKDMEHITMLRIHAQKQAREKQMALLEKEKALQRTALKSSQANLKLQTLIRNVVGSGLVVVLLVSFVVVRQRNRIAKEKKRSDQLVVEKEMLMKEIHHRVKNNLEVISSLLELQSEGMEDGKAKAAMKEGQSRVQSIALIHHQLYRTDDVAKVEFVGFVTDLYRQIESVFRKPGSEVDFEILAEEVSIGIDSAVPLGLIINELVTNSFKYAIRQNHKNRISIQLKPMPEPNQFVLIYRDNGPGLPADFNMAKSVSLGMKVIKLLTRQLGGKLHFYNEEGSVFEIPFVNKI